MSLPPLPIDPFVPLILDAVRRSRAVVVTAPPGAGKTTRVPPALMADGPVVLLQPRRVAARAVAQRIAAERGWTIGGEVGWQIRFERRFGPATRLLVATEGILTARLQQDPLLSAFTTIVLDEFHERSIHADLAIALARQAWRARATGDDALRIVVMSATIDAEPVAAFLDGCPIVHVPGRQHPIEMTYAPDETVGAAAAALLGSTSGDVLCFLPGAQEIRRAMADIESRPAARGVSVVPLYGTLDAAAQDAALRPVGVRAARHRRDQHRGDVGDRAGRHGRRRLRAAQGRALRRRAGDRQPRARAHHPGLRRSARGPRGARGARRRCAACGTRAIGCAPHREPEIHRIDLTATALDVIAWGGDPRRFEWFEPPREDAVDAALALLDRLGAVARRPAHRDRRTAAALPAASAAARGC